MSLKCRFCSTPLHISFCDLGQSPISNGYLTREALTHKEPIYPLHAYVCEECFLVQLQDFTTREEIFTKDYAYFSSYSTTWLKHCKEYAEKMITRFALSPKHQVVEIASNDGYLLTNFKEQNIPILGVEPAESVAKAALQKGIPTHIAFFGRATAENLKAQGKSADLLLGNNVLAHVPDLNDFVGGMKVLLKPSGIITMEFPHLMQLMKFNQFDTIYHEHFSYFSFLTVEKIFAKHGLKLFDVEQLPTHGGSLRIYATHAENESQQTSDNVSSLRTLESANGYLKIETYTHFQNKVEETKKRILAFFQQAAREGKKVVGYGAPAKGNTLLNYCAITQKELPFTVDRSPHKQGLFLPGTHLPIYAPEKIFEEKPDYIMILPWNLKTEIQEKMAGIRSWGGKFVIPIPQLAVVD